MNGSTPNLCAEQVHASARQSIEPRLAVIVPCYNEAEAIDQLAAGVARLQAAVAGRYALELVFVDDASTDDTHGRLKEAFVDYPHVRLVQHATNRGIAAAIASGIAASDAEIIATIDADSTYEPSVIAAMTERLNEAGADMVVASPYHPQGHVEGVPRWRLQLSRAASRMYRLVLRNKLHTYTSCVRVFRRDAVCDLAVRETGFVGVVELLWALDSRGGRIVEHPATLSTRKYGQSKMKVYRTTLVHLRFLARAACWRLLGLQAKSAPPDTVGESITTCSRFAGAAESNRR